MAARASLGDSDQMYYTYGYFYKDENREPRFYPYIDSNDTQENLWRRSHSGGGASFLNQPHMSNPHKIPTTYSPIFINHLYMTVQLAM